MPTIEEMRAALEQDPGDDDELNVEEMRRRLATGEEEADAPPVPKSEVFFRGLASGGLAGFADEGAGAVGAVGEKIKGSKDPLKSLYKKHRDESRALHKAASDSDPLLYLGGEVAGGVGSAVAVPGSVALRGGGFLKSALTGAAVGGAQGLGYSEEEDLKGMAKDAGISAGIGGAASAVAHPAGKVYRYLKKLPKKALSSVGGVHEKNIDAYLKGSKRINAAPEALEIEQDLAESAGRLKGNKEAAERAVLSKEAEVKGKYSDRLGELKKKVVPTEQADALLASLDLEKAWQREMSDKAYDALAQSDLMFRRSHLLDHIKQEALKIGAGKNRTLVGKEAASAVADLRDMYMRAAKLPSQIDGPTLRNVLKQIRSDINYGGPAGSFNKTADVAKKNVARGVSEALKSDQFGSPEYRKIMGEMAPRADSLEEMSQFFGTKEKALAALEAVASENTPRSRLLAEKLQNFASQTGNKQILDNLAEIKEARSLLARSKTEDLTSRFFPDDVDELGRLRGAADEAAAEFEPARRITPERAQAIVKNVGGPNAKNIDKAALDYLGMRAPPRTDMPGPGRNFVQEIEDRGVLDSFSKDATRGSKNVNLGAAIGNHLARGAAGSAIGGASTEGSSFGMGAGAVLGALSGTYGPQMTKRVLDAYIRLSPKDGTILKKAANSLQAARARGPEALKVTQFLLLKQHPELKQLLENNQE